jgi:hypothetical protein
MNLQFHQGVMIFHSGGKKIELFAKQAVETLRNPHCLDNRFTDGGKVVSPAHRPRSTPQKHYSSASATHFC